jgi:hypothetical protein
MGALRDREPISVQLVAVPVTGRFERADMELTLEQIDLIVSPMQVRSDRG